jgi:hypothetical protein
LAQTIVVDHDDRANLLNKYFGSACADDDDAASLAVTTPVSESASIDNIEFSPVQILVAISKLKNTNSSRQDHGKYHGQDGLPQFHPFCARSSCRTPLIFTAFMSVKAMQTPRAWVHAIVTPRVQDWRCI